MRCSNCGEDKWENVDFARIKPAGMHVCQECGFISYPEKWKTKEEIFAHYRSAYRQPPTANNIFSGERKNHFHHVFLLDLFNKWKADGLENPKICEIGAAMGYTLHWIKTLFPKAEIHGTELTTSFRRNAFHEFGINLTEDIDTTKKYDLIISYKVLEHQLDPDLELKRYTDCLTPDGLFYISVPTWFNSLQNFGMDGFDLEYYFDPNHINVWTIETFENILARAGFEIIKSDQVIYSSTYLCKANPELTKTAVHKESPDNIKNYLTKIRDAYMATTRNEFEEAIKLWPDYPQAHISAAEMTRKKIAEKGWPWFKENVIEKAIQSCPTSAAILISATDFAMRSDAFDDAIKYCEMALKAKPENPVSLHQMANLMRELAIRSKNPKEQVHYFVQAREVARHLRNVSTQHFKEATDLAFLFNAHLGFEKESRPSPK